MEINLVLETLEVVGCDILDDDLEIVVTQEDL